MTNHNEKPTNEEQSLSLDTMFDLLSNERRRHVLRYLRTESEVTLSDLAEHLASIENDKPVTQLTSSERKRVYVALYQVHLPRMDDAGVIAFDNDTIELAANAEQVLSHLPAEENTGPTGTKVTTALRDFMQTLTRTLRCTERE